MKRKLLVLAAFFILILDSTGQPKSAQEITAADLESHVKFLASPLMKGRMNGEESLGIAANYLAAQADLTGLRPANGDSFFQPFTIMQKKADPLFTAMIVSDQNGDSVKITDPFFHIIPQGPAEIDLEGEVVFAGYGIKTDKYNDLEGIDLKGKILIVMDRGPVNQQGRPLLGHEYYDEDGFQYKIGPLLSPGPKAVIFVPDPLSGHKSYADVMSGLAGYLSSTVRLEGVEEKPNPVMAMLPKVIFANRSVADVLLNNSGKNLEDLQREINSTFKPVSFLIADRKLAVKEQTTEEKKTLNNVAAFIEGSHPEKKNEVLIYSAHYDHIGAHGDQVNAGADDDASGCAALLEMADAFSKLNKKPLRSVLFLWVAGEEIGLYGSETYVSKPLFPLEKTVANLNMDMIGRTKEAADSTSETPMTGPSGVFVITGGQSRELTNIAADADKRSKLDFDYSLSGRDHHLQLFSRSDHYNFVKHDIPVLFFTTGLHADYHSPRDIVEKINFEKMELVTRTMYEIGFIVANRKERIVVDNPFSSWTDK